MDEHAPLRSDRSAAVKEAILAAARTLFTSQGFEGTGIREIAAQAEVNHAIVIRHFGSKERLFVHAIDGAAAWDSLLDGPLDGLGRRVMSAVVEGRDESVRTFGTTIRASGRPEVYDRLRETIDRLFVAPLAERMEGPDAVLRAHLFAAQLVGILSAFSVYSDEYLGTADPALLIRTYGDGLQRLLTPSPDPAPPTRG